MRSFTTQFKSFLLTSLITVLAINLSAQQWTPPTGHPNGGQWTFFTAKAQIDGVDMVAGDQLAIFDGAKLVGAFTLTQVCNEVNMYGNQWIAYEKLDEGGTNPVQGYTPGNAYTFKAWKASTNAVYSNYSLSWNTLVGNGFEHSVFPTTNTYTWDYPQLEFYTSPGIIEGTVTKTLGGTPIQGATATIKRTGHTATSNASGFYQFGTVVAGTYRIIFTASGYGTDSISNVVVTSNATTTANIALSAPPGTIAGTISNADGPIAGATILTNPGNYAATANNAGVFSVNVPPGTYNVIASAAYHNNKTETGIIVVTGQTTTKNFTLVKANGALKVTVFDVADNEPIENATVTITPGGSSGQTDEDGEISFNNLDAGTYNVNVVKADYTTVNQSANVVDGYLTNASVFLQDDAITPTYPANYTAFPGGNPNEPVWTIYIRAALINGTPLVAGDAIAVYDDDLLVGLKYLTAATVPSNEFTNFVSVFSELNNGDDGYQHGNAFTIEAYRAADNSLYTSNVTLSDPYSSGAYIGTTFPYGDNIFSFASLGLIPGPGEVKGWAFDNTQNPLKALEDVLITAIDTSGAVTYTTLTDENGVYTLEGVVPGVYNVTAALYGFTFNTWSNLVVPANSTLVGRNFSGTPIDQTTQTIDLSTGFQFVSTRIQTGDMNMNILVNDIKTNLDFVKNTAGSFFHKPVPPTWTNNIGNWVVTEGYLFNMKGNDQLSFTGIAVAQNTPITVVPGFQFIAYLPDVSLDAKYAMTSILADMEYLRASDGSYLRKIGPTWVNNIGTMNPGEGYLLKMKPLKSTNAYTLTYPAAVLATVTTTAAIDINSTGATVGGNVTHNGDAAVTERGIVWGYAAAFDVTENVIIVNAGTGSFSHQFTTIDPGTKIYYKAYATNVAGTKYGTELSFTTDVIPPTVTTAVPSDIWHNAATSGGEVTNDGGDAATVRGIVWGTTADFDVEENVVPVGSGSGSFTYEFTGLAPSTTRYYRAYATNDAGTFYGDELSFITYAGPVINRTKEQSYSTIQGAIDAANSNDEIEVASGIYAETIDLNVSGLWLKSANGAAATTISGGAMGGENEATVRFSANNVTLDGFTIDNNGGERAIGGKNSVGAIVKNNIVINSDRGFSGDWYGKPTNVTISNNTFNGVARGLSNTEDMIGLTVKDNIFMNISSNGVSLGGGVTLAVPVTGNDFINIGGRSYTNYEPALTQTVDHVLANNTFDKAAAVNVVLGSVQQAIYSSIQAAIDNADNSATITVAAGTYAGDLTINKGIILQSSSGAENTIIEGVANHDPGVVNISASNVTINGFTIQGSGMKTVRVTAATSDLTFTNNIVITANNSTQAGGWSGFETNYNNDQTNHVISNNTFIANNSAVLFYYNPNPINMRLENNIFQGTAIPVSGMGVGFDGLDGIQVITGNNFQNYTAPHALLELFGTYDISQVFQNNSWPANASIDGNKIVE